MTEGKYIYIYCKKKISMTVSKTTPNCRAWWWRSLFWSQRTWALCSHPANHAYQSNLGSAARRSVNHLKPKLGHQQDNDPKTQQQINNRRAKNGLLNVRQSSTWLKFRCGVTNAFKHQPVTALLEITLSNNFSAKPFRKRLLQDKDSKGSMENIRTVSMRHLCSDIRSQPQLQR